MLMTEWRTRTLGRWTVFGILLLVPFIAGCPRILSIDYRPSVALQGHGSVKVEGFRYIPAEEGRVKAKQVQLPPKTAISLWLTTDIAAFFAGALRLELTH